MIVYFGLRQETCGWRDFPKKDKGCFKALCWAGNLTTSFNAWRAPPYWPARVKCSNPAPFPNRQSMQKHKPFRFNSIPVLRNSCGWSIVLTSIRGFVKLCMSLRDDFLLFVAKCLHVLAIVSGWPWQEAKHVGVKVTVISCFDHALLCMMRRNCNVLCRPSSAGPLLWV